MKHNNTCQNITTLPNEILDIIISFVTPCNRNIIPFEYAVNIIPIVCKDFHNAHLYRMKIGKIAITTKYDKENNITYLKFKQQNNILHTFGAYIENKATITSNILYHLLYNVSKFTVYTCYDANITLHDIQYTNICKIDINEQHNLHEGRFRYTRLHVSKNITEFACSNVNVISLTFDPQSKLKVFKATNLYCNDVVCLPNTIEHVDINGCHLIVNCTFDNLKVFRSVPMFGRNHTYWENAACFKATESLNVVREIYGVEDNSSICDNINNINVCSNNDNHNSKYNHAYYYNNKCNTYNNHNDTCNKHNNIDSNKIYNNDNHNFHNNTYNQNIIIAKSLRIINHDINIINRNTKSVELLSMSPLIFNTFYNEMKDIKYKNITHLSMSFSMKSNDIINIILDNLKTLNVHGRPIGSNDTYQKFNIQCKNLNNIIGSKCDIVNIRNDNIKSIKLNNSDIHTFDFPKLEIIKYKDVFIKCKDNNSVYLYNCKCIKFRDVGYENNYDKVLYYGGGSSGNNTNNDNNDNNNTNDNIKNNNTSNDNITINNLNNNFTEYNNRVMSYTNKNVINYKQYKQQNHYIHIPNVNYITIIESNMNNSRFVIKNDEIALNIKMFPKLNIEDTFVIDYDKCKYITLKSRFITLDDIVKFRNVSYLNISSAFLPCLGDITCLTNLKYLIINLLEHIDYICSDDIVGKCGMLKRMTIKSKLIGVNLLNCIKSTDTYTIIGKNYKISLPCNIKCVDIDGKLFYDM